MQIDEVLPTDQKLSLETFVELLANIVIKDMESDTCNVIKENNLNKTEVLAS